MSNVLARRSRWLAYQLVLTQVAIATVVTIVFFGIWGAQFGISAFAGMLIAVLPNFVFATFAFAAMGASQSRKVLQFFYFGEAIKLLLTIVLFCLVFASIQVEFIALFTTYTIALAVHGAASFLFNKKTG